MKFWYLWRRIWRHGLLAVGPSPVAVRLARYRAYKLNGCSAFPSEVLARSGDALLLRIDLLVGDPLKILVDVPIDVKYGTVVLAYHAEPDRRMIPYLGRAGYLSKPDAYLSISKYERLYW